MRLSRTKTMPLPKKCRLLAVTQVSVVAFTMCGMMGCSAAVVDADRTAPPSGPGLMAPGPAGSVSPQPTSPPLAPPTTLSPMSLPTQPTEGAEQTTDGLRHVPIDSVFQPPTPLEQTYHEVKAGESLSVIAKRYGTTAGAIQQANGLDPKATLAPGQLLLIPK